METMAISKFKATCLSVLDRVEKSGRPILVTKRGKPVAQVIPPPAPAPSGKKIFGCMADKTEILGDIMAPLPESDWEVLR